MPFQLVQSGRVDLRWSNRARLDRVERRLDPFRSTEKHFRGLPAHRRAHCLPSEEDLAGDAAVQKTGDRLQGPELHTCRLARIEQFGKDSASGCYVAKAKQVDCSEPVVDRTSGSSESS